jgi:hypothetical protein
VWLRTTAEGHIYRREDFINRDLAVTVGISDPARRKVSATQRDVHHRQQLVHSHTAIAIAVTRASGLRAGREPAERDKSNRRKQEKVSAGCPARSKHRSLLDYAGKYLTPGLEVQGARNRQAPVGA